MALPSPEPGLVIGYAYLWHNEHAGGAEEGLKDRPAVITLTVTAPKGGKTTVTVLPITHSPPSDPRMAVEIPAAVKAHLGLDGERSWIVVTEGNEFEWPGYDLRHHGKDRRYDYGFLPPRVFQTVLAAFVAWHEAGKAPVVDRD